MVKLSRTEQGRTGYSREAGMFPVGAISSSSSSVTSSALLNFTFEELNHHNGEVEQDRTGQNRAEQGRTGQNRAEQCIAGKQACSLWEQSAHPPARSAMGRSCSGTLNSLVAEVSQVGVTASCSDTQQSSW